MSTRDKCMKCIKVVEDGIVCFQCESIAHLKCVGVSDELYEMVHGNINFKWFCDGCLKLSSSMKILTKSVDIYHKDVVVSLDAVKQLVQSELKNIKKSLDINNDRLSNISNTDLNFSDKINDFKNEINATWAAVAGREVKKSVDVISERVDGVQKMLNEVAEMKDKEMNMMIFRLAESSSDRENVFKILRHLSNEKVTESDDIKIIRLGRKTENVNRPVLVRFKTVESKELVMRNVFLMKTLSDDLSHVNIRHDLTKDQRVEYKKLIEEAKTKESACKDGFLYRVRGALGKWKVVKFQKRTENV